MSKDDSVLKLYPNEITDIRNKIQECLESHEYCRPLENGDFFPTRLLDLRTPTIRLIDGQSLTRSDGRYATLSYCWGKTMPEGGNTTIETIDARRTRIDVALLPRTLRQAIYVTRTLEIPFLWIDSLCIIQGNAQDWTKESVTMCQIYNHAILTIGAGATDHCDGGFLGATMSNFQKLGAIDIFKNKRKWETIKINQSQDANCLLGRGWTFQERELSTRMICFAPNYTQWECRQGRLCYSSTSRLKPRWFHARNHANRCLDLTTRGTNSLDIQASRSLSSWHGAICEFSRRSLTNPRDKLAAIAGLASAMQPWIQCEFFAGHWIGKLQADLMWFRHGPKLHPTFTEYYGPSWSWTSTNFPVQFLSDYDNPYIRGRITTGSDIIARKLPGENETAEILEMNLNSSGIFPLPDSFVRLKSAIRSLNDPGAPDMHILLDDSDGNEFPVYSGSVLKKDFEMQVADDKIEWIQQLIICILTQNTRAPNKLAGLVLQSFLNDQSGVPGYRRVGVAFDVPDDWVTDVEFQEIVII